MAGLQTQDIRSNKALVCVAVVYGTSHQSACCILGAAARKQCQLLRRGLAGATTSQGSAQILQKLTIISIYVLAKLLSVLVLQLLPSCWQSGKVILLAGVLNKSVQATFKQPWLLSSNNQRAVASWVNDLFMLWTCVGRGKALAVHGRCHPRGSEQQHNEPR